VTAESEPAAGIEHAKEGDLTMAKSRLGWVAALLTAALTSVNGPSARAAEGQGDEILKQHGLKIAGSLAVALEESEVKSKLAEARRLSKQLSYTIMQQKGTMSPAEQQKTMKTVNDQLGQLRSEMNAASQQMNAIPKYRGRFMTTDASQLYSQLAAYRSQLQMEINQDSLFLNQLKSQPADPKAKERVDSEVRDLRDAYHQAILDLRKLVDAAHTKYEEAANNDEVKKALGLAGKGLKEKPKLGPSHDFQANVKILERLEKAESSGENEEHEATKSRRSRTKAKAKNSSKAASAPASPAAGSPDDPL
jgi:hypothetical protein